MARWFALYPNSTLGSPYGFREILRFFKPDRFVGDFFGIIVTRPSGFPADDVLLISRRKRLFSRFSLVHEDVVMYDLSFCSSAAFESECLESKK